MFISNDTKRSIDVIVLYMQVRILLLAQDFLEVSIFIVKPQRWYLILGYFSHVVRENSMVLLIEKK